MDTHEFVQTFPAFRSSSEAMLFDRMDERLTDYLVERSADNRLETTH